MNGSFFPRLIIVSGPSGVGKSTILREVLAAMPHVSLSISCTTRDPRPSEVDGYDYFFIDRERFQEMIEEGAFLEWAQVYNNFYGTTKQHVFEILARPQHALLDVDTQGALRIRENCTGELLVFIMPPSVESLRERLTGRGTESAESLERRLSWARHEMSLAHNYDEVIVNTSVQDAVNQLAEIIRRAEQQPVPFRINWESKAAAKHPEATRAAMAADGSATAQEAPTGAAAAGDVAAEAAQPATPPREPAAPHPAEAIAQAAGRTLDREALVRGIVARLHDSFNPDVIALVQQRVDHILQHDLPYIVADAYRDYRRRRH
jgi:guanylate kinase